MSIYPRTISITIKSIQIFNRKYDAKKNFIYNYVANLLVSTTVEAHTIGEYYQGGVIFWIDDNDEHGLIASLEDQGTNEPWTENSYVLLYAIRDGVFAGKFNTEQIVNKQGSTIEPYAALLKKNYNGGVIVIGTYHRDMN